MADDKKCISVVVSVYNEELSLARFYETTVGVLEHCSWDYELVFVNDGSADGSIDLLKGFADENKKVRVVNFSRNFGHEAAMIAGIDYASGDGIVCMDADLQHPPELLVQMIDAIEKEGYDRATARRVSRKGEPLIRSAFSKAFYSIINHVTVLDLISGSTDYCLMKRTVVDSIVSMSEKERFTKGIYSWVGFRNKWIEYENVERAAGHTKWSFLGLLRYAYNGFIAFATTPLRGVVYLGIVITIASFWYAASIGIAALRNPLAPRTGYNSIMIVLLFLGGVIITTLGVIGEYLARIYMEVKNRPIYIERETNIEREEEKETECASEGDKSS